MGCAPVDRAAAGGVHCAVAAEPVDLNMQFRKRFLGMQMRSQPGPAGFSSLRQRFSNPLLILMILVGVVLLIACANMANLLIARSAARHRETAVRLAIGAGRWRLIRQLLTESVLISAIGAALGLAFAEWSVRLLVGFMQLRRSPISLDVNPDWRVLAFTASAAILTGLLFGLFPALQATRLGINIGLKQRAQNVVGAPDRFGVGRVLLGGQVALSVLLVAGSGLFAGSLLNLWTLNPGFNPRKLLLIGIDTYQPANTTVKAPPGANTGRFAPGAPRVNNLAGPTYDVASLRAVL